MAYLSRMADDMRVIFNGECPVCSHEIGAYARYSEKRALPIQFEDLNKMDLTALGLTADTAAQRLHVVKDGKLLVGVDAFVALWSDMPRFRWLARLVGLPGIRQVAGLAYNRVVAPVIYARHKRRKALVSAATQE